MAEISRRKFIGGVGATGAGLAAAACVPKAPAPPAPPAPPPRQDDSLIVNPYPGSENENPRVTTPGSDPYAPPLRATSARTLVYVSLFGGNDGFNTVIPYTDTTYKAARGSLALNESNGILPIGENLAFHPSFSAIHNGPWAEGKFAVVRGVGYPNPDRSHFRSTDIWHTGRPDMLTPTGWGGLWLDHFGDALGAIAATASLPRFLRGATSTAISIGGDTLEIAATPPQQQAFRQVSASESSDPYWASAWRAAGHDLFRAADTLEPTLAGPLPTGSKLAALNTRLANDLKRVLKLIANPAIPAKIYYVNLYNFDTHSAQLTTHAALLKQLSDALAAFHSDLGLVTGGSDVTTLVSSEFGRRLGANASGGTDHGSTSHAFLMGGRVNGGFHGQSIDLNHLDPVGDPIATIDLRSVVGTVLARQLAIDPAPILGGTFPQINLLAA